MRCSICGDEPPEKLVHLPIYVSGSEGVDICYACKMAVTEFIREVRQACNRSRVASVRAQRELGKENV